MPPFTFQAAGRLVDFMRQADEPGLINLAAGVPGLDALPCAELEEAFRKACLDGGARVFAYQNPEGDRGLRALLAERMTGRGVPVQGSEVLTTTGCQQALQLMLSVLVKPGDVVACQVPIYYALLELISAAGAKILPIEERGTDGIDVAEATGLLEQWRPKCFFLCSTLSNPSTATLPDQSREELVKVCRRLGVRIVEDDIYGELADAGAPKPMRAYDDGSTVSYVSSFSKSVSPGLRVGFCVPGTLFEETATLRCQQDMHGSVLSETTLRAFIEMGQLEPHLARIRERNRRRREVALTTIARCFPKGTKVNPPIGGYMLWAEMPEPRDLAVVRDAARKDGVVFAGGRVFFPTEPEKTYLRLNCSKVDEAELVRGLEVLGGVLAT